MAKVSREMLKGLVKECLFEILLESTGESTQSLVESRARPPRRTGAKKNKTSVKRPALDSISFGSKPKVSKPRPVDVSSITSDPVMASIFQDTAATTLREQAAAERGRPGTPLGEGVSLDSMGPSGSPSSLLGEASQNWAYLAFNDKSE